MDAMSGAKPGRLLRVLTGETLDPAPWWLMRQAGRYLPEYREVRAKAGDFVSLCLNPELASEVTLQPVRALPLDAAILFSDLLVPLAPLGVPFDFKKGEGPVIERPLRSAAARASASTRKWSGAGSSISIISASSSRARSSKISWRRSSRAS